MDDSAGRPYRNRVAPTGEIVAIPLRGAWTGNRGIIHRGHEIVRFHAHEHWLTCALQYKDSHRVQWLPHRLTWLFFHDEAVSFAAGHRPCALCRRPAYNAFRDAWGTAAEPTGATGGPLPSAKAIDGRLHGERLIRGTHRRRTHAASWSDLPDGAFVLSDGPGTSPALVLGRQLVAWTHEGYGERRRRPARGEATLLTPPSTLAALRAGYPVQIDASASAR